MFLGLQDCLSYSYQVVNHLESENRPTIFMFIKLSEGLFHAYSVNIAECILITTTVLPYCSVLVVFINETQQFVTKQYLELKWIKREQGHILERT